MKDHLKRLILKNTLAVNKGETNDEKNKVGEFLTAELMIVALMSKFKKTNFVKLVID